MIKLSGENRYPTNERNGNIETGWYREENYSTSSLRQLSGTEYFFIEKTTKWRENDVRYQTHS